MTTALQRARARLRLAARVGAQLAELMDFLGFAFMAQLARAALFAALALLLLLDLLTRVTLHLAVLSFRFMGVRLWRLLRASTVFWVLVLVFADINPHSAITGETAYTLTLIDSASRQYIH